MTITKSPTGLQIDCTGPEESAKLFAESETCDEFANIVLRGVAGK